MAPVAFISHTWLGYTHPDPQNVKWKMLQEILRKGLRGKLDIFPHWTVTAEYVLAESVCIIRKVGPPLTLRKSPFGLLECVPVDRCSLGGVAA